MVQIKCNDVSLGYDGKNIVEHLNFEIESGDFIWKRFLQTRNWS